MSRCIIYRRKDNLYYVGKETPIGDNVAPIFNRNIMAAEVYPDEQTANEVIEKKNLTEVTIIAYFR